MPPSRFEQFMEAIQNTHDVFVGESVWDPIRRIYVPVHPETPAPPAPVPPPPPPAVGGPIAERLRYADALYSAGLMSIQELERAKQIILKDI